MFVKDFFKCNGNNYEIEKFPLWNGATFMLTTFRAYLRGQSLTNVDSSCV